MSLKIQYGAQEQTAKTESYPLPPKLKVNPKIDWVGWGGGGGLERERKKSVVWIECLKSFWTCCTVAT